MTDAHLRILLSAARRYAASPDTRAHDARLMFGAAMNMLATEAGLPETANLALKHLEAIERVKAPLTTLKAATIK